MSEELSRRTFLALASAATTLEPPRISQRLRAVLHDAVRPPGPAEVVRGNARFQVLSPTLVRMEYAPSGHFINAPSVAVLNRHWPGPSFEVHDRNGAVEIVTSRMRLAYMLDSGPFTEKNIAITWTDTDGAHAWKPGDVDDKNLGGVPGKIDVIESDGSKTHYHAPGPLSRNGYYQLDDSKTAIWNAATQWPEPRPGSDGQDWYFFVYGRDYKRFFHEATQLLGQIPMVPRYVFGTWFGSRAGYSADEWQRIVSQFREEEIPLDIVVLDCYSWAAFVWSGYDSDPEQFPDPKGFMTWMKAHGVKVTLNEHYDPITPESDHHFEQVRQAMGLPPGTKEISHDLANKKYAELYMDLLHKPMLDAGMAFWWQDGYAPSSMPGLDPYVWTRYIEYEGQERITGKRAFVFCRMGPPGRPPAWGGHRYGSFFSGDLLPYWSTLASLVPVNVESGNTLIPFINNLTLGVSKETVDIELYQRWVQFSAFAPLFWWHGVWGLRLPWENGPAGLETAKQFLRLRYRLLPYIYTYARLAHETGAPLVRGTWLEYPLQEQAYAFPQQYLFGAELLVSPITSPGGGQPVATDVYLPADEHWYDYFTGDIYPGGQVLSYECPLSRIPLFVRAGAILPMSPDRDSTDAQPADPLTVEVFTGKAATFRLYEDDGTSLDYRKNAYAWTPITYTPAPAGGDHHIMIGPVVGHYRGQRPTRRYCLRVHGVFPPKQVQLGERTLPEKERGDPGEGWLWHKAERVLEIDLVRPTAVTEPIAVTLRQAGEFRDVVAVQAVRKYRERLRRVKLAQKSRWAVVLAGRDMAKQPHALQVTEQVEQQLNDMIANPAGVATRPPDVRGMTATVLAAFITHPFDSTRTFPEKDPDVEKTIVAIANETFTPDERRRMTADLLDCRLIASTTQGSNTPVSYYDPSFLVHARVLYDTTCIAATPTVTYELILPKEGDLPLWDDYGPSLQPDGRVTFGVRVPFELQGGTYWLRVRATLTWESHQVVLERDVPWVAGQTA